MGGVSVAMGRFGRPVGGDTGGADRTAAAAFSSISADGRYVAFSSLASDLVKGLRDRGSDVFVARWSRESRPPQVVESRFALRRQSWVLAQRQGVFPRDRRRL